MLTEGDLLSAALSFALGLAVDTRATSKVHRVDEAMSGLVTIAAEGSLQEAAEKLRKHRVDCLPVLERGTLVGIVTTSDLLRALAGPPDGVREGGCTPVSAKRSPAPSLAA